MTVIWITKSLVKHREVRERFHELQWVKGLRDIFPLDFDLADGWS